MSSDDPTVPIANDARQPAPAPNLPPVAAESYAVGEEIAHGGMGRILRAQDRRLGRTVAIKELTGDDFDGFLRFEREVRITAHLEHPAIVPVYEAGVWSDGRPFYAMKLVSGQALDAVVAATTTLDERLALLPHVIAVAEAMAYAHDRRVIDRDLKPANVLCGAYGETVVIDWGLAKDLNEARVDAAGQAVESGPGKTQHGAAIGTPAYMSPEQARGEPADERADVYGLGALLYHVLAGRPPYDGGSAVEVIEKVASSPPPALAAQAPGVPRELATIVDRAMARTLAARYPSAKEMAADLRRFQTGQLVGAHQYSSWALFRRWIARRRAAVQVAAVLLVALAVVVTLGLRRIFHERDLAERARGVAVLDRDAAEDLVQFIITDLRVRLRGLRKLDLLDGVNRRVEAYYDKVGAVDADAQRRYAAVLVLMGDMRQERGDLDGALALYQRALGLRKSLGLDIAETYSAIADVRTKKGDLAGAERDYKASLLGYAGDAGGASAKRLHNQSVVWQRLGDIAYARGDLDVALADFRLSCDEREKVAQLVEVGVPQIDEASCQHEIGDVLLDKGALSDALAAYQKAFALCQQALAVNPRSFDGLSAMAASQERIGDIQLRVGHGGEALASYQDVLATRQQLFAVDATNVGSQRDVSLAWQNLGNAHAALGQQEPARDAFAKALAIAETLAAKDASNVDWQRDLELARIQLATALLALDRPADALALLTAAAPICEALVAGDPKNQDWRRDLTIVLGKTGDALRALKRLDAAEPAYRRSLGLATQTADPDNAQSQRDLADAHAGLGRVLVDRGRRADALVELAQARAIVETLNKASPDDVQLKNELGDRCRDESAALGHPADAMCASFSPAPSR